MSDKKISQLPNGNIEPNSIIPIVTLGVTSQTTFTDLVEALEPYFSGGTGGDTLWSAGTGVSSITTLNTNNVASGDYSIAEGVFTTASGQVSRSEGRQTIASGILSHAQGDKTVAGGTASHAEGYKSEANGETSHAEGNRTEANGDN